MSREVFLSYSSRDAAIVTKVQLIIFAAGMNPWRDKDDIRPGDEWKPAITTSIERCERMLVFWCRHSSASAEVRSEYEAAIARAKPVASVIMDGTPVVPALKQYHHFSVASLVWFSHRVARWENLLWLAGLSLLAAGVLHARL